MCATSQKEVHEKVGLEEMNGNANAKQILSGHSS